MKILVIGGAGYIGSHMVRALLDEGIETAVFDNLSTGHRAAVGAAPLIEGDLLDPQAIRHAIGAFGPSLVMHFAALSLVSDSMRDPLGYYRENVGGIVNLLDAMLAHGVQRLVFSSSASLYGTPEQMPIDETAAQQPSNTYGWCKLFAERVIQDACRAHGLRAAALRYFNAAGAHPSGEIGEAHQPETHLIPNVLRAAAGAAPGLVIHGSDHATPDGYCVRDFVHVDDLCAAHLLAARALDRPGLPAFQAYNLGTGRGFSVMEVLAAASAVVGRDFPFEIAARRDGDPPQLVASSKNAREVLGWAPRYRDIGAIIETAWRWHQQPRY